MVAELSFEAKVEKNEQHSKIKHKIIDMCFFDILLTSTNVLMIQ